MAPDRNVLSLSVNQPLPCRNSKLISPFIFRMSSVGLDPVPLGLMGCCQVNEFLPEILIQYLPGFWADGQIF